MSEHTPALLSAFLLLALTPPLSLAQSPGDTVKVVVPEDKNCSDFVSQQAAQGWYDAIKIITGQPDAHSLDADGDGQPCEGIDVAKREVFSPDSLATDTLSFNSGDEVWVEYELLPARVSCGGVPPGAFRVDEFLDETRYSVDNWNTDYLLYIDKAECIHMIGVLKDHQ